MDTTSISDDLRRYAALLWHWAWLLVLLTILGAATSFILSKRTIPVYQSSTRLLINEAPATKNTDYASVLASERLARTYSELLTTQPVLSEVISRLELNTTERALRSAVDVNLLRDTQLIDVSVEDTIPARAADIANAIVDVFSEQNQGLQSSRFSTSKESLSSQLAQVDQQIEAATAAIKALGDDPDDKAKIDRLETALGQYRQTYASLLQSYESVRLAEATSISNVVQVEAATPISAPIRPRTLRNTVLGAFLGLVIGIAAIILIDLLDDTLNPENISRHLGLPILGIIAHHQVENGDPVVNSQPRSPVAEAFRSLRTNIQFASVDTPVKTLLVTSPSPEDGKSTVAVNLGVSLAQSGNRVTIIDTDLRRPQVHKRLGLPNRQGISAVLVQPKIIINGAIIRTKVNNLSALTSGALPPNPAELLGSDKMSEILSQAHEKADIIVLDAPPVLAVTDASVLAPRVDGVLLVVKPGVTKLVACKQAVEQLNRVGAKILGVVLNDISIKRSSYRYAYYRGYYYDSYDSYYDQETEAWQMPEKVLSGERE